MMLSNADVQTLKITHHLPSMPAVEQMCIGATDKLKECDIHVMLSTVYTGNSTAVKLIPLGTCGGKPTTFKKVTLRRLPW